MDNYQLLYELIAVTLVIVGCVVGLGLGVAAFAVMIGEIIGEKATITRHEEISVHKELVPCGVSVRVSA